MSLEVGFGCFTQSSTCFPGVAASIPRAGRVQVAEKPDPFCMKVVIKSRDVIEAIWILICLQVEREHAGKNVGKHWDRNTVFVSTRCLTRYEFSTYSFTTSS